MKNEFENETETERIKRDSISIENIWKKRFAVNFIRILLSNIEKHQHCYQKEHANER